jgi:microcystin-dependent protein
MTNQFVAEVRVFPYSFSPVGWAFCRGQLMSIAQNTALFSLVGTTYGGDGVSTFGLPNLQDSLAVGIGQGIGLSPWVQGQVSGAPSVALTILNVPPHTHQASAGEAAFVTQTRAPSSTSYLGREKGGAYAATADTTLAPSAISTVGGGLPHSNLMPVLVMNYNIALQGIFPSRN